MHWRKNGKKLSLRKAIREEAHKRLIANRRDYDAMSVYAWVQKKIRRFYNVAPMNALYPISRKAKNET